MPAIEGCVAITTTMWGKPGMCGRWRPCTSVAEAKADELAVKATVSAVIAWPIL
jgi:hypothetical protein